jgi:hypothetical protein
MAKCENCGGRVPAGATSCPECGLYAGQYEEGQAILPRRPRYGLWLAILAIAAILAAASSWLLYRQSSPRHEAPAVETAPVRVVKDRPGGARRAKGAGISEPEAILLLRRHFTSVKSDCIAILSNGYRDGAYQMTVVNGCDGTRLGKWRVDGGTKTVTPASPASR